MIDNRSLAMNYLMEEGIFSYNNRKEGGVEFVRDMYGMTYLVVTNGAFVVRYICQDSSQYTLAGSIPSHIMSHLQDTVVNSVYVCPCDVEKFNEFFCDNIEEVQYIKFSGSYYNAYLFYAIVNSLPNPKIYKCTVGNVQVLCVNSSGGNALLLPIKTCKNAEVVHKLCDHIEFLKQNDARRSDLRKPPIMHSISINNTIVQNQKKQFEPMNRVGTKTQKESSNGCLGVIAMWICIILAFITGFAAIMADATVLAALCFLGFSILGVLCEKSLLSDNIKEQMQTDKNNKEWNRLNGGYKCPNCGRNAGHPIGSLSKSASIGLWGLASNKIGKTYKCENCDYMW